MSKINTVFLGDGQRAVGGRMKKVEFIKSGEPHGTSSSPHWSYRSVPAGANTGAYYPATEADAEIAKLTSECDQAIRELGRLGRLVEKASALSTKMESVYKDERYEAVWTISQMHIGPYTGPKYTGPKWVEEKDELDAAIAAEDEYFHKQKKMSFDEDKLDDPKTWYNPNKEKSMICRAVQCVHNQKTQPICTHEWVEIEDNGRCIFLTKAIADAEDKKEPTNLS